GCRGRLPAEPGVLFRLTLGHPLLLTFLGGSESLGPGDRGRSRQRIGPGSRALDFSRDRAMHRASDDTERIRETHRRLVLHLLKAVRDEESPDELLWLVASPVHVVQGPAQLAFAELTQTPPYPIGAKCSRDT